VATHATALIVVGKAGFFVPFSQITIDSRQNSKTQTHAHLFFLSYIIKHHSSLALE
jgi:hypothetical protein